ncbi:MAG: S9 family peptidase [Blastocatellia bacterium]|nr:S9 family peptidase [Blastocatellia bacterium]
MKTQTIRLFSLFAIIASLSVVTFSQTFNVNDMINLKRVGDPQLSPDGTMVAYTVGIPNKAENKTLTQIFVKPLAGGRERQLTDGKSSSSSPRWSPDGKRIAYVTGGQIWTMEPDGDDKDQITEISTGAGNPVWSPDGSMIAFGSDVYPECRDDACNKAEAEKAENSKVKAHVTDRLLFRRWVEWRTRIRTHVFVVPAKGGIAKDVTPGDFDAPPYGAGTGHDYVFTPDSKGIVYIKNPDKVEAVSTNSDIFVASLDGSSPRNLTASNKGYDMSPAFTPDGKYLIYRSMATAGFEADRARLMRQTVATGETVELTGGFDQQVDEFIVTADSNTIYFTAAERGRSPIFSVPVEPNFRLRIATHVKKIATYGSAGSLNVTRDGSRIVFAATTVTHPTEIFSVASDGTGITPFTTANDATLASFKLNKYEDVDWKGAVNTKVHGFLLKPANFDPGKKYPMIVLIHGGPQGAWNDGWSYRWNPQIYANAGYIVFAPNPRGSTGYGQQFVNEVSADWGGKAYVDIMNGVAEVIKQPFVDKNRIGAAGASYGGYMVDWILGHNTDPRFKFKALLSHAGVYNLESMATSTEEIYFVKWEFKGMPWENPVNYNKWSPHKFAKNFNTPTLVTAGELDYRVPVDQSYQLYTTLQLRNVPSKLIVFPDEGHWILKHQNSEFFYNNALDWFKTYLKP